MTCQQAHRKKAHHCLQVTAAPRKACCSLLASHCIRAVKANQDLHSSHSCSEAWLSSEVPRRCKIAHFRLLPTLLRSMAVGEPRPLKSKAIMLQHRSRHRDVSSKV